jgi:UDP-glucose 4-epimerase
MLALEKLSKGQSLHLNLGTGVGTSVKEIIEAAEKVTGKKVPVKYGARRAGDPSKLYATNRLAKEVLGWNPKYTNIEDIIQSAWAWEQSGKFLSDDSSIET